MFILLQIGFLKLLTFPVAGQYEYGEATIESNVIELP